MLQAYKNDKQLKRDFIKEIKWHQDQDKIVQGTYGEGTNGDFKGCAVGCSIHSLNRMKQTDFPTNKHELYETELGIPEWLARLEDMIFEDLPAAEAQTWPLRFSKAINVGANLEPVKWQFCAYLMHENIERVLALDIPGELKEQVVSAIRQVLTLHETAIETGTPPTESATLSAESAARTAESAAESAARSAALSAWLATATLSAESAALSALSAAASAALSALSALPAALSARSAAASVLSAARTAESAAFIKHSKKLLSLLKAAA